ncbi:MAG: arsenate reductase ArsC [Thermodesulfobacteriota bacterium]|nr:MAG: arsenate reductase ArsC [Thermodesulfobacteriota bacterium]
MSAPKKILFLCVGNTCRSQMAEGFARHYGGGDVEVRSAGTSAAGYINRTTIAMMKEKGIDISSQTSDQVTDEMLEWADVVVTMGCCSADEVCPASFKGEKQDWPIEDPLGMGPDFFRRVRDDIEERVKRLVEQGKE